MIEDQFSTSERRPTGSPGAAIRRTIGSPNAIWMDAHERPRPVSGVRFFRHPTNLRTISRTGSTALVCWMLGPATQTVLYVACCAAFSVAFMPM